MIVAKCKSVLYTTTPRDVAHRSHSAMQKMRNALLTVARNAVSASEMTIAIVIGGYSKREGGNKIIPLVDFL